MAESYSVEAQLKATGVKSFASDFKQAAKSASAFNDSLKGIDTSPVKAAGRELTSAGETMKRAGGKATSAGKTMMKGITLPLAGVAAAASATGMTFDDSMAKVQAISGATGSDLKELRATAKEMGSQTKFSASQSADALQYMSLAGWDAQQMVSGLPGVLNLAAASGMELANASDIVTDTMSQFGMKAEDATKASDIFAQAQASSNMNVQELSEALKMSGATAATAGMDLEQTSAILGVFANNSLKGSRAGTTLDAMFRDLKKSADNGKIAIGETQVALYDAQGEMRSMGDILADVEGATNGMTGAQRDAALAGVFQQEAMRGVNLLLNEGTDSVTGLESKLYDAEGASKKMGETMEGTLGGTLREIRSALEGLAISVYEVMRPALQSIANHVKNFVQWLNSLSPAAKAVGVAIGAVAAAIGPLLAVFGAIVSFAGMVASNLGVLAQRFAPLIARSALLRTGFAALSKIFALLVNPITGIVVLITSTLIPLFATLYQKNETFRTTVQNVWSAVKSVISTVIQEVSSFVMQIWGQLVSFWQEHGQMILQAAQNVWNVIKTVITTAMNVISTIMKTLWPVIKSLIVSTWNAIKGTIQGAIDVITGIIQAFSALFTGNWSALWDAVKQIVSGAVKLVWNLIQLWFVGKILKLGKALFNGLRGIVSSLWNTIKSLFRSGVNVARNVVSSGFNFIRSTISSIMNAVRSVISSIWNAIRSRISSVVNSIKSTVSRIFNSLRNVVSSAFNRVKSAVRSGIKGALNIIKGMFGRFTSAGKNIIGSIVDGIKGSIGRVKSAIGNVTQKIRNFLPFSPAKEGALKDIMDVQIGESIAKTIDKGRKSAERSMQGLAKGVHGQMPHLDMAGPDFNIANDVQRIRKQSQKQMRMDFNNEMRVSKQPIEISNVVELDGEKVAESVNEVNAVNSALRRVE